MSENPPDVPPEAGDSYIGESEIEATDILLSYGMRVVNPTNAQVVSENVLNYPDVLSGARNPPSSGRPLRLTPEQFAPFLEEVVKELEGKLPEVVRAQDRIYDNAFWDIEYDDLYKNKLVGVEVKPSEALEKLIEKIETHWTLDCAQWVQVVQLEARRRCQGNTEFDKKMGKRIELRDNDSPGLIRVRLLECEYPASLLDESLKKAPIGCRVMWSNYFVKDRSIDYNQNTIKLGENRFGLHHGEKKNIWTREEIEDVMFKTAKAYSPNTADEVLKNGIWISQIEEYQLPC